MLVVGAVALTAGFEGLEQKAYPDLGGVVTVCYGHTGGVKLGDEYSKEACRALLATDLEVAAKCVRRNVSVDLTQNQFDALVDFTFNVGCGNFAKSTLLKRVNREDPAASAEFNKWVYVKGKFVRGLQRRREAERDLFDKP
jgi:lysozyme